MVIKNVNLETVCGITSTFPDNPHYEVAFAGKSNVGKSSLINALMNRKSLARTSSQPGKTQTINFYNINDAMYLVDLPGYGYARTSKKERGAFAKIILDYVFKCEKMHFLFVLVDSRLEPQKIDLEFIEMLGEGGVPFALIFTKCDKQSVTQTQRSVTAYKKRLSEQWEELPPMLLSSSEKGQGRDEIVAFVEKILTENAE
jgi:GTP-binding protein